MKLLTEMSNSHICCGTVCGNRFKLHLISQKSVRLTGDGDSLAYQLIYSLFQSIIGDLNRALFASSDDVFLPQLIAD